jgi:hypothetical protein
MNMQPLITITWFDSEETILSIHCERGWKWKDMAQSSQQTNTLVASKPYAVDAIYNLNHTSAPLDISILTQMASLASKAPANTGKIYILNTNSFGLRMVKIFTQTTRLWSNKMMVCNSLQEALDDIQKRKTGSH